MVLELGEVELTVKGGCLSPDNKQEVREGCYQQSVWQRPCARESKDCLKRCMFKEGGLGDTAFA